VEHLLGVLQDRLEVTQFGYLTAKHPQNDRQVVGRVGESYRGIRSFLGQGLAEHHLCLGDDGVGAPDGASGNVT
jgi:hypothetical protein